MLVIKYISLINKRYSIPIKDLLIIFKKAILAEFYQTQLSLFDYNKYLIYHTEYKTSSEFNNETLGITVEYCLAKLSNINYPFMNRVNLTIIDDSLIKVIMNVLSKIKAIKLYIGEKGSSKDFILSDNSCLSVKTNKILNGMPSDNRTIIQIWIY